MRMREKGKNLEDMKIRGLNKFKRLVGNLIWEVEEIIRLEVNVKVMIIELGIYEL